MVSETRTVSAAKVTPPDLINQIELYSLSGMGHERQSHAKMTRSFKASCHFGMVAPNPESAWTPKYGK